MDGRTAAVSHELVLGVGLLLGGVLYFVLAGYVWLRRHSSGGTALFVFLVAIYVWSKCYALELASDTVGSAGLWSGLKYVGIVTVPAALWVFVRQYTGRRTVSRRTLVLLTIEPVTLLTLLALPWTRQLVHSYPPGPAHPDGFLVARAGPLLWVHALYSYTLLAAALWQFAARLGRVSRPYRRQAAVVIVASVVPLVGNALYNLDVAGLGRVDPAPFLFVVFAVVLVWGVFRLRLLDLLPVARGLVVEQMPDGVLVLDAYSRVVDANPAGARLLGVRRETLVGRYVEDLLPEVEVLFADHVPGRASREEFRLTPGRPAEPDLAVAADPEDAADPGVAAEPDLDIAAELTSLLDASGAETGRLLLLRDISHRTAMEWRLRDLLTEQTRLAETLQAGLRPASLPEVPGLELAARWLPAQEGGRVSGDFYDVHQTLGGDHAFVLGDVSGKGVHAAVVTSLARYTTRTLSAQGWTPAQVLEQLNQTLLAEGDEERYCTVAYGRMERLQPPEVGDGVRVTLALGGHPQPLVHHLDGSVEAVGRPGTALGLVPRVEVTQVTVHLRPGEILLAYTDGVTDARSGNDRFGEARLERLFATTVGAVVPCRGSRVPDVVADRVLTAVTSFASRHDDIALLVLAVC